MSISPKMYWQNILRPAAFAGVSGFAIIFLGACNASLKSSTDYLVSGKEYFKAGDYKKAEADFQQALKQDAGSATTKATATNNLGVIFYEEGRYDEAIPMLKDATSVDPKNAIAHYVLANALSKKGKFEDAYAEAVIATDLDKTEPGAYRALGEAALGKKDVAAAISSFRTAVGLEPDNDMLHHRLAVALGENQDWEGQLLEEKKAIDLNPENADARIALALALHKKGDIEQSIAQLQEVLKSDANNADAKKYLETFQHERVEQKPETRLGEAPSGQNKTK